MVGVEVFKWLWLLIECKFLAIEFKFELGLALRFDDSKIPDWETISLAMMNVFLITILTLNGVSVSIKLRPELDA